MPVSSKKGTLALAIASLTLISAFSHAATDNSHTAVQVTEASMNFSVPAQPLASALTQFGRQAKLQLSYKPDMVAGKISAGVMGSYTPTHALSILLSGTGIRGKYINESSIVLVQADTRALSAIKVEGQSNAEENAWSEVEGFVVLRSHAGNKTDTPIIETPQAISVVNSDLIQSRGSDSVNQSLRYTAGIHPFANFDSTTDLYTIRGIESDNGIFLDGTQHRVNRFDSAIEPYGVERIEVIKGPSSVLYGANSPGGLINAVSKQPLGKKHGEVGVSIGSHQRKQVTADIGDTASSNQALSYRLTTLIRKSDTQVEHIQDDRKFFAPSLTWDISDKTSLTWLSYYQHDETDFAFGAPRVGSMISSAKGKFDDDLFIGEPDFNGTDRTHYSIGYMLNHAVSDDLSFRQNVRYFDSSVKRKEMWDVNILGLRYDPGQTGVLYRLPLQREQNSHSLTIDNQLQLMVDGDRVQQKILVGVDYRKTDFDQAISTDLGILLNPAKYPLDLYDPVYGVTPVDINTVYSTEDSDSKQLGLYAQNQLTINDNIIATLSGRQDRVSNTTKTGAFSTATASLVKLPGQRSSSHQFSGRFGIAYLSETGLAPYYSYSESFLPVTGVDTNNHTLEPETGQQNEVGLKFQSETGNSFVTMAVFDLVRENVVSTNASGTETTQIGEIRSQGFELEATASFDNGLNMTSAYTHTEARTKRSLRDYEEGLTPVRIPEDTASVWLAYRPEMASIQGLSFGMGGRFTGRTYDQSNHISIASYSVFDTAITYDVRQWAFSLNANNVFDRRYIAQCSSNIDTATGLPQVTDCSFGQRRQVNLTAQYRWGS